MAASEGQRLFSCAAAEGAAELRAAVKAVLEGGGERTVRLVGEDRFRAGRRPVAAELVPETDASGAVVSVLGAFVDGGQAPAGDTALERELMRLRLALKGSTDGWWDWDLATDLIFYSARWWEMLGYAQNEMPADAALWRRLCHPDDLPGVEASLRAALASGAEECDFELRLRHKSGDYRLVSARAFISRDPSGRPVRISGTNQDITDRRRIELEVRDSERQIRQLFDSLVLGFSLHEVICDSEGKPADYRFIEVNSSFESLTGLKRSQLIGRTVLEVLPGTEPYWIERFGNVAITGRTARFHDYSREFGKHYEVVCYCPKPGQFAVLSLDITERIRLEEAVRQRELRMMHLIENASDLITIVDAAGVILYQSPSIERVLGYLPTEILGRNLAELVHPDEGGPTRAGLRAALEGDPGPVRMQFRVRTGKGEWRQMSAVAMGIGDERQIVVNARDVTEEHLLAAQLRQSQKMEAIGQLAGGIAHDFNNLLTAITGYGSLVVQEKRLCPEDAEHLSQMLEAAGRASRLTQQLLAFSRRQAISLRIVELNAAVANVAHLLARLLGERIRVELDLLPEPIEVEADLGMLEQVLMNLSVNARDAMPDGGRLTIGSRMVDVAPSAARSMTGARPGRFALLSVEDTGTGIDLEVLPRIFEPFFTTKGLGKGTGLGLPTVLGIVEQHQGWIHVDTRGGRGSRFEIYLPPAGPGAERATGPRAGEAAACAGGTETLLVAEDDHAVRLFLRRCLGKLGYDALIAEDGEEALALWKANAGRIRLLLTDVVMPGRLDGRALAREIRREAPLLPVIYASGYNADAEGRSSAPEPGARMLRKPFDADELAGIVRLALDTARQTERASAAQGSTP